MNQYYLNSILFILICICLININTVLSDSNNNSKGIYVSNLKGSDSVGCGLSKDEESKYCKSIEYTINQYKNKFRLSENTQSKFTIYLAPGEYSNIQQDLYDLNISFESLNYKDQPILISTNPEDIENEQIDMDDESEEVEDQVNSENSEEVAENQILDYNYNYFDYEILEEIYQIKKQGDNEESTMVLFKNVNFFISSKNKNEISFKGITFQMTGSNGGNMEYILNFNDIGGGLILNVLNCQFESDYNKFINVQESNSRIEISIRNSKFNGNHLHSPINPLDGTSFGSVRIISTVTTTIEIDNCVFKNIRGTPILISTPITSSSNINTRLVIKSIMVKDNIIGGNSNDGTKAGLSITGLSTIEISNSMFESNVDGTGLSIFSSGKGIIENCLFYRNRVKGYGGALNLNGISSTLIISDSVFLENYAYTGASINIANCKLLELQSNKFIGNTATLYGASVYCSFSNVEFTDSNNQFDYNIVSASLEAYRLYTDPTNYKKPQHYFGFDCLGHLDKNDATCFFKGTNSTMVKELLQQPNCSGSSYSIFLFDNLEYIVLSLLLLFVPIGYLFYKISKTRNDNFKNFLIQEYDTDDDSNQQQQKQKQQQTSKSGNSAIQRLLRDHKNKNENKNKK